MKGFNTLDEAIKAYEDHFNSGYTYAMGYGYARGEGEKENIDYITECIATNTPLSFPEDIDEVLWDEDM